MNERIDESILWFGHIVIMDNYKSTKKVYKKDCIGHQSVS